tara:strand:+ start:173 stop:586 length:414 start_codon:yes stop_codon:yes gene_type:complete
MTIKKWVELINSENFKNETDIFIQKWYVEQDNEDRHINTCREYIKKMTIPEFISLVVRICEWETKYEEREYKKGFITTSNVFQTLFKAVSDTSNARPCNEDFLYNKYIYKGLTFKKYVGQGIVYRITMRKRLIFQSI